MKGVGTKYYGFYLLIKAVCKIVKLHQGRTHCLSIAFTTFIPEEYVPLREGFVSLSKEYVFMNEEEYVFMSEKEYVPLIVSASATMVSPFSSYPPWVGVCAYFFGFSFW